MQKGYQKVVYQLKLQFVNFAWISERFLGFNGTLIRLLNRSPLREERFSGHDNRLF